METNNKWMSDPALKDIDKAKLDFLDKVFIQSTSVNQANQKEMLSFLLSLSKMSRDHNISFNQAEINLILNVLEKYSSPDDISKMKKISSLFRFQ